MNETPAMTDLEKLIAQTEANKVLIVALLGVLHVQDGPLLRGALQRSQAFHEASWPYEASLSDRQIDYAERYIAALIDRLPE